MKRKEKRIYVMHAIKACLKDYFTRNPYVCSNYCCKCDEDCCKSSQDVFLTFYDKDKKRIVGNWYNNSNFNESAISALITDLMFQLELDIHHLMWGMEDATLHQIRFLTISSKTGSKMEYDLFQRRTCSA